MKKGQLKYKKTKIFENKEPRCVLVPHSKFFIYWNLVMIALLTYTAILMPVTIVFVEENLAWQIVELMVDGLFLVDVVVNCFSAYYDLQGKLVTDKRAIIWRYFKGWMVLDIVASIPFQLITSD